MARFAKTEAALFDQPEKPQLEHRIIEINNSGKAQPSNTVVVIIKASRAFWYFIAESKDICQKLFF